ncbi:MAG: guanylate kinase [Nitrospirae bacterium]|nr:guanylate kinase [Nitrospirota bacterium]MCL5236279.1 guanylate kinase [Nitrospirota bacterium]
MRRNRGNLFVISAPSGAGKTTLCAMLCETFPNVRHSVSYTTRAPRPGETNDVHYTFVYADEFRTMIGKGEFIEWAEVHGNFYGTSRKRIEEMMHAGLDVILDIDVQGAKQMREKVPDSTFVFILPPSMDVLRERLTGRMSDSDEVIRRRLKNAGDEIREYKNYNYVIVNDTLEAALKELISIIIAERVKISKVDRDWIERNFLKEE